MVYSGYCNTRKYSCATCSIQNQTNQNSNSSRIGHLFCASRTEKGLQENFRARKEGLQWVISGLQWVDEWVTSFLEHFYKRHGSKRIDEESRKEQGDETSKTLFLWEPHISRDINHKQNYFWACPDDKNNSLCEFLAPKRARDGPESNKRGENFTRDAKFLKWESTAGCLHLSEITWSCSLLVSDWTTYMVCTGRWDDGSDEIISSSQMVEATVIKGVGRMSAISPVYIQVALHNTEKSQTFWFSRAW